jgi:hypothetical protein
VANDEAMTGKVNIDRERGPSDEPGDTLFIHRFSPQRNSTHRVIADYIYVSKTYNELFSDHHILEFSNPLVITEALLQSGFREVSAIEITAVSPFLVAKS